MRLNGTPRLLAGFALLPLLAGLAFASGSAVFVCRGDLVARTVCCCPASEHAGSTRPATTPSLSAACCCDVQQLRAPTPPAVTEPKSITTIAQHGSLPAVVLPALSTPPAEHVWLIARVADSSPPTIPILLAKQSFLL